MASFHYQGTDLSGRSVSGTIDASDRGAAAAELRRQGLVPWKLVESARSAKAGDGRASSFLTLSRRADERQVSAMVRQLAGLLRAGIPIDRSLRLISQIQRSPQIRAALDAACEQVKQGALLAGALIQPSLAFPRFARSVIQAGETSGDLEGALVTLADVMDRTNQLKSTIRSGLAYPLFTLGVSAVCVLVLVTFVVPSFSAIFDSWGAELPFATRALIWLSTWLTTYWLVLLISLPAAVLVLVAWIHTPAGRLRWDGWLLRLPVLGQALQDSASARLCRTLGAMLQRGVPLNAALELSSDAAGNARVAAMVRESAEQVKNGSSLALAWRERGVLSPVVPELASIGEETGELASALQQAGELLEEELQRRIKLVTSLFEPALIVIMAGVVGFVVLSILLPVITLGSLPGA